MYIYMQRSKISLPQQSTLRPENCLPIYRTHQSHPWLDHIVTRIIDILASLIVSLEPLVSSSGDFLSKERIALDIQEK